jgi:hypothetical protein
MEDWGLMTRFWNKLIQLIGLIVWWNFWIKHPWISLIVIWPWLIDKLTNWQIDELMNWWIDRNVMGNIDQIKIDCYLIDENWIQKDCYQSLFIQSFTLRIRMSSEMSSYVSQYHSLSSNCQQIISWIWFYNNFNNSSNHDTSRNQNWSKKFH